MKRPLALITALTLILFSAAPVTANPPDSATAEKVKGPKSDDLPHPLLEQQRALKQDARIKLLQGEVEAKGANQVVQVGKGQFVELAFEGQDEILTFLGEFGPGVPTHSHGSHGGTAGPLHNQIPEPDRSVDNSTIWQEDFDQASYDELLFSRAQGANSMANFYLEQSSGRYTVDGYVGDWVQVPNNTAAYGSNYCGSIVCADTWLFVQDQANAWYNAQIADGMSAADINALLADFDVWDRYDHDGDGNFDEPDGYIDHFQSVHAGIGEESCSSTTPVPCPNAIWSHRWYAFFNLIGVAGPPGNLLGGIRIGTSNFWVGDYTIEPENGGLGVFAHEFGHDLGLPDLYDTSGNVCGSTCENSTGFWTLMSGGANLGGPDDIGSKPSHMGAWEKFQLGWLNYDVAFAGVKSSHRVGPAETNTKAAQGLFVVLPDKPVDLILGDPPTGTYAWWSTKGNEIDTNMTRSITLPAGPISLSANVWYEIEECWDYAYLQVSTDGGATWASVPTNRSDTANENGQNFGQGITGTSGRAKNCATWVPGVATPQWVPLTADLSAYAGSTIQLRFRYWTDPFVVGKGFEFDDLLITSPGGPVFSDGAESTPNGWTLNGFVQTDGSELDFFFNAYLAEFRQYRGYDAILQSAYNFISMFDPALWKLVERFPYQDGLLINYWDTSQEDNNTSAHPGSGLILPVDAHPSALIRADGQPWRNRIQTYDSTFGFQATDPITLHWNNVASSHPSLPAVSLFNDLNSYWNPAIPFASVQVPHTGTSIRIVTINNQGQFMQVNVNN